MKSAEWSWGTGNSRRMSLIKSATTESLVSATLPNSRYYSTSWTVDDGAQVGSGSRGFRRGALVRPVITRTSAGERDSRGARCR